MAKWSRRKTIVLDVIGWAALIAIIFVSVWFASSAAERTARRNRLANGMKQIGLGVLNFHQTFGRLPVLNGREEARPPGNDAIYVSVYSWRYQLVGFIEGIMLDFRYDEPWYASANRYPCTLPYHCYCWSPTHQSPRNLDTNVVAITGPGTAFDEDATVDFNRVDPDTILAIEIANSGIHWMEPGDLDVNHVPESIVHGLDGDGVHVLFADGRVQYLRADVPLEVLKKFFTIAGARQYDRDKVLGPYYARE